MKQTNTYNVHAFTVELSVADNSAQLVHKVIHVLTTPSTRHGPMFVLIGIIATLLQPAQYHFKY